MTAIRESRGMALRLILPSRSPARGGCPRALVRTCKTAMTSSRVDCDEPFWNRAWIKHVWQKSRPPMPRRVRKLGERSDSVKVPEQIKQVFRCGGFGVRPSFLARACAKFQRTLCQAYSLDTGSDWRQASRTCSG